MKKASKILLIIAGALGILASLGMLLAGVLFSAVGFIGALAYAIYGIVTITTLLSNGAYIVSEESTVSDNVSSIIGIVVMFAVIIIVILSECLLVSVPGYIGFALLLTASILAFVASKKGKKGVHIASIVFSTLSVFPALCYTLYALLYTFLILIVILSLLTPIGWLYLGILIGFWGTLITFVLSILGDIFGLIALAKQKKEEETQSLEVIENVQ